MEISIVHRQEGQQQSSKGGIRTIPLIIGNEAFQFIGGLGLVINMIVYLRSDYHMGTAPATMFLFLWNAGSTLLWLTAIIPGAKPAACNPPRQTCQSPILSQMALLHSSFLLMSIGNAGIRPCSLAFGADQFDKRDNPNNAKILQSFFNWYYAAFGISAMIAITVIVYIQQNYGWKVGLGIPVALTALSAILFFVGSPFYVKMEPQKSLLTGLAQAMVAAFRNRHLDFPLNKEEGYYQSIGSNLVAPTNKLRFLNKACIIRNREKDLRHDGSSSNPWSLCTVDQVEDLKSLLRLMPIWSTSIILFLIMYQQPLAILQVQTMDLHLGKKFKFPPGSIGAFGVLSMTTWVAIYDRIIVPHLGRLTNKQRLGIGLMLSCVSPAVAAIVERSRRDTAIQQGLVDAGTVSMSFTWIIPQILLNGLAEGFHFIGQNEFYYNELPKNMSSIGMALFTLGTGFGNLLGSLIVKVVALISTTGGKESCWAYGACKEEPIAVEKAQILPQGSSRLQQSTLHHRLSLSRPDSLVRYDAVPVLCTRLTVIENLDVAEQCLQALRNISRDLPVVCLNAGVILAVLSCIDSFSTCA
ncbi:hypothetical protein MRB53_006537 [Persea americana]|uniref:Uncharacterized protein n=1 Tax=Persea americana TaxID=3435 RepID=A0ACC2MHG5_PERAE|nr:hypothetical protein MRB53_006537 [Persea americana]